MSTRHEDIAERLRGEQIYAAHPINQVQLAALSTSRLSAFVQAIQSGLGRRSAAPAPAPQGEQQDGKPKGPRERAVERSEQR